MNRSRIPSQIAICGLWMLAGCGIATHSPSPSSAVTGDVLERTTEKGPVKLVIRITPPEPRLSDLVEMEILATALPGVEIKAPAFGQAVGDFLVRDYSERKETQAAPQPGQPSVHRFRYQLEPTHAGRHLIRSLAIEFIDHRPNSEAHGQTSVVESEPLEVLVTSELGDKLPNLADLEPMLAPRPLESPIPWGWLSGAAACVVLAAIVFWRGRRRIISEVPLPRQTPEEIAHAALTTLLSENLPSRGLVKDFYLRLTGIVRHFIEGTTGLRAPEQTTEEFLFAMRSKDVFSPERSVRLKDFLEAADMVKYAGQQPDGAQIDQSIARAREFVDLRPDDSASLLIAGHAANPGGE